MHRTCNLFAMLWRQFAAETNRVKKGRKQGSQGCSTVMENRTKYGELNEEWSTLKLVKFDCAHPLSITKHDLTLKNTSKTNVFTMALE